MVLPVEAGDRTVSGGLQRTEGASLGTAARSREGSVVRKEDIRIFEENLMERKEKRSLHTSREAVIPACTPKSAPTAGCPLCKGLSCAGPSALCQGRGLLGLCVQLSAVLFPGSLATFS